MSGAGWSWCASCSAGSDSLLLDEPTNHLDADARNWLLNFLRQYRGALLVVSHDLDLLDEAITRVLHLDRESKRAPGRSSNTRAPTRSTSTHAKPTKFAWSPGRPCLRDPAAEDAREQDAGPDGQAGAGGEEPRPAGPEDRVPEASAPQRSAELNLKFPAPPSCGRTVLTASELWQSFGSLDVYSDISFDVGRGERLLVTGLNGAGKTTLLKALAGDSPPTSVTVELGTNVSIGYYAQEHEGIVAERTLLEHMRDASDQPESSCAALLGMFGLGGPKAYQDAATLSGGEKTKLALAQLVGGHHNLLMLDEPTNNLDPRRVPLPARRWRRGREP